MKPINEFELRHDRRYKKPYLRSTCKDCRLENKRIYSLKNKYKILTNIYNKGLSAKCSNCDTGIKKLPALDFHHPSPELKQIGWHALMKHNWKSTMLLLEKEKVVPLCRNCHHVKQATIFNQYKDLIIKKNDFETNFKGINKKIHQYLKSTLNHKDFHKIRQIKPWIKKRIIIEKLYAGRCIGCGENSLASLHFHHRDNKKKTYNKWGNIQKLDLERIERILKRDNVIALCANCHRMAESHQFEKNVSEILGDQFNQEIKEYYKDLKRKIKTFSFKT